MSNVITIENTDMQIREYNGQRVVTFKDIDAVHERPIGTAKRNFTRNKKHFIEDEDYFSITKKEFGTKFVPNEKAVTGNPNLEVILLTETGYLMLVKSFKDDLAWTVQRQLVNAYFKVKNEPEKPEFELSDNYDHYIPIRTRKTPVPRIRNFYKEHYELMCDLAKRMNTSNSKVYHNILKHVGEEYDLREAERMYTEETGHPPKYTMDLLTYFKELRDYAWEYLEKMDYIFR